MKKIAATILAMTATLTISACSSAPKAIEYEYNDISGSYTGEMAEGVPEGYGEFTADTLTYKGDWEDGLPEGSGEYNAEKDGATYHYIGDFAGGEFEGDGEYKFTKDYTTVTYKGEYLNGQPHDNGDYVKNKSGYILSYKGEFVNGKQDGKGVLETNTNEGIYVKYTGEFNDGAIEGSGSYMRKYKDGVIYTYKGSFMGGKPFGFTELTISGTEDGSRTVITGEFNGFSVPDGLRYAVYDSEGNEEDTGKIKNGEMYSDNDGFFSKLFKSALKYIANKVGFGDEVGFIEDLFSDD